MKPHHHLNLNRSSTIHHPPSHSLTQDHPPSHSLTQDHSSSNPHCRKKLPEAQEFVHAKSLFIYMAVSFCYSVSLPQCILILPLPLLFSLVAAVSQFLLHLPCVELRAYYSSSILISLIFFSPPTRRQRPGSWHRHQASRPTASTDHSHIIIEYLLSLLRRGSGLRAPKSLLECSRSPVASTVPGIPAALSVGAAVATWASPRPSSASRVAGSSSIWSSTMARPAHFWTCQKCRPSSLHIVFTCHPRTIWLSYAVFFQLNATCVTVLK
ncbi:hypothetical protein PVAP13_4NG317800 [Panicum virgatum]|uniref:Uncharacterized protein n=1 Tax=Panicum virgatum TaxID=38727 RepID=A0A8T0TKB4_PANVG|nr:hypothetical protein PVAP13_4NG317800 [Panicum virgatum]